MVWYIVCLLVGLGGGIYVGSRWPQWFYFKSSAEKVEQLVTGLLAKVRK